MTTAERIKAVAAHGFTERQARFLVIVMQYSGICLPRQYAAFAGIVYGDKTWTFFERLVQRRYAIPYRCRHHRGRIYHVRYKPLYRAIGNTDSRHRRSMSAAQVIERLTLLDALIATPNVTWLTSAEDRQAHFAGAFPEAFSKAPIGVDPDGRVVLLVPVMNGRPDDFRAFIQRCAGPLSTFSTWTLRVAVAPQFGWLSKQYEEVFRQELASPLPDHVNQLRSYFERRRAASAKGAAVPDEEEYHEAKFAYGAPRFQVLYRRWLKEGDTAFDVLSSAALATAITTGAGRLECAVLPFSYRHLSPLVDVSHPLSKGAEEVDEGSARLQPSAAWLARIAAVAADNITSIDDSASEGAAS